MLARPFWRRVSAVGIGLMIGLVLAEVVLRVAGVSYPVFDTYDYDRAVALRPGKEGWYSGEGGAYLKINSLGYRDVEHAIAKPPGVYRIAVLGDSFTEARQVDVAEAFWKRLETSLPGRLGPSIHRVEVLNFGVGGYGITQEYLTLKMHALKFSPDLVILAFCPGNDLASNSKKIESQVNRGFSPYYVLRDGKLVLDNSFRDVSLDFLRRRFLMVSVHYSRLLEVVNQVRRIAAARRLQQNTNHSYEIGLFDEEFVEPRDEVWKEAWRVNETLIAEIHREVRRAGASFVLATLTTPIQVEPDVTERERFQRALGVSDLFYTEHRLRELGRRLGFGVITLAERLQAAASRDKVYFHGFPNTGFGHGHWNEQGHRAAAEILTRELPRLVNGAVH